MQRTHQWKFFRAGGVDQVILATGEDIAHLDELDPKLWVALSMPVTGVDLDTRTIELLDLDKDGHIRHPDVLGAVTWLRGVYASLDPLFQGGDVIQLAWLKEGPVKAGIQRVLTDLGRAKATELALNDIADVSQVFAATSFNGDGVVPADAAEGDTRAVIDDIIATHGSTPDRSGKPGIDLVRIDAFFAEARALLEWSAKAGAAERPIGEATTAAADATRAVRGKIDDYFVRCRLASIDPRAADVLRGAEADLQNLAGKELSSSMVEVGALPIAPIGQARPLPLDTGVNPAWAARLKTLGSTAVEPLVGAGRLALSEDDWVTLTGKLGAHEAWWATRPSGAAVALGEARLRAIVEGGHEAKVRALLERDLALKPEVDQLTEVEKLARLQRDFVRLLRNYVNFSEFYADRRSVFQIGRLYLDARSCELVVPVSSPDKHAVLASMSGAYLAYLDCVRAGEKLGVVAAVTAGDSDNIFVGRNGVLIDHLGRDWDATIIKIVDNPISIRQAFTAPYKKLARWIEEQVQKRASAAQSASDARLQGAATTAAVPPPPTPPSVIEPKKIDVGTVAALGVAIGGIGAMVTGILAAIFGLGYWMPLGLLAIVLVISTPSMLLAYLKLRQRNLGPLLDANGWAINGRARINVPFGAALTELAKLPAGAQRASHDPYAEKRTPWKLYVFILVLIALGAGWYLGKLDRYLPRVVRSTEVLGGAAPAAKKDAEQPEAAGEKPEAAADSVKGDAKAP